MTQMGGRIRELTRDYLDACRAAAELVETKESGKEKSGWFKEHMNKFLAALASSRDDEGLAAYTSFDNYWT